MPENGFRDVFYSAQDGLNLHARVYGEGNPGLPVVCLPGLTRNARDFHALAEKLSTGETAGRKVIAFDYRGRGLSDYDRDWRRYDVTVEAADIVSGLAALGVEHAAFIGTSRGGLIIMALAGSRPTLIKAAVLNDIGPVVEGDGLAQIRAYLQRAPTPATLAEAIEIQKTVHAEAFPALDESDWERFSAALYKEDRGRLRADFDPNLLKQLKAINLDKPLPTLWPLFGGLAAIPLLAVRGENSRLFSSRTLEKMAARHPTMQQIVVPGQGHAPLLETGNLPKEISAFIKRAEKSASS
ncbi:alpha/beta fold hydrolase [Nitratireductor kimnyeongensis]|uniref:Alpha/beta fold hydrolase n=1 Tax=Nitratireductor kimnyeongensis TaxID=430679 RepID=A0ABW0T469_9HYPH|nr:alpha/beta hydrolase [Nitratireductor kimnyeongensis]QZZ35060.1 alpha/beta hydrolase [Nitratireductor kimnyeongensis]